MRTAKVKKRERGWQRSGEELSAEKHQRSIVKVQSKKKVARLFYHVGLLRATRNCRRDYLFSGVCIEFGEGLVQGQVKPLIQDQRPREDGGVICGGRIRRIAGG